jgi:hypothetical protein
MIHPTAAQTLSNYTPPPPMKTTPATPRTLKIQPFTVTTEWVSVTTSILASHGKRMQRIQLYQKNRDYYCTRLVEEVLADPSFIRRLQMACFASRYYTGKATSPFTFVIEANRWAEIEAHARRINSTPTAFIRAAIAHTAEKWARFDQEQARTA